MKFVHYAALVYREFKTGDGRYIYNVLLYEGY